MLGAEVLSMVKPIMSRAWLDGVEALEERLETAKLIAWGLPRRAARIPMGIVHETAGLLKGRVASGAVYQRRLRHAWELNVRRRTA